MTAQISFDANPSGSAENAAGLDAAALVISSDGHASAAMRSYKDYLPAKLHEEFADFCALWDDKGGLPSETRSLVMQFDPEELERWDQEIVEPGRIAGYGNMSARLTELDRQGIAAEVLFPDFGRPFEIKPLIARLLGYSPRQELIDAGNRAYNRWLAEFCSQAPERFAPLAAVSFSDVDETVAEIRWAHAAGLRGIVLPCFDDAVPLFDRRFDPVWATLAELGMPANCHIAISSVTTHAPALPELPHPTVAARVHVPRILFFAHQMLGHFIWGGVLERHPDLQVAFTEMGSDWVVPELRSMDYVLEGSWARRDIREIISLRPSEYWQRQCHLGSSIFSRAEIEARGEIGLDKMMLGMDFPHHEGTWAGAPNATTLDYLQATLGAAQVPVGEARQLLSGNASALWKFDTDHLQHVADRIGPTMRDVLSVPDVDRFPRGDVHKPNSAAV
ncbi:amidohydrolase family protein [Streptomyces sp. NPDC090088]|uniref:amidohydrolase family protein n=1 Tax=Streptomyces sp. NPDC090088 TaxID=3365944 RepID=UPI00382BF8FF